MAGGCCKGSVRVLPRLDPAECNALEQTAAGLTAPRTEVAGIAPGGAVGTERSVDVDVQAPAAGECPETWTVGARLTPVHGMAAMSVTPLNFAADQANVWIDLPGTEVVLPQAGTYNLDATWRAHLQGVAPCHHYVSGRIWDVTAGAVVPLSAAWVCTIAEYRSIPGDVGHDQTGDAHVSYTVPGPRTIRMQAVWVPDQRPGYNPPTFARMISAPANGLTRMRWTKVSD